jgi:hypothetical protein
MSGMRARAHLGWTRHTFALLVAACALCATPAARAETLDPSEQTRLASGQSIVHEQTYENDERRFVGGLTYTVIEATPEELFNLFDDVAAWRNVLPKTKSARTVGQQGADTFVELSQGNALITASYTLRLRKSARDRTVRFWLDPERPHAIDDAWGFFRADAMAPANDGTPRTLLTFGVLVDMGPGLARALYEERMRAAMLGVPQLVRQYVARTVRRKAIPT